MTSIEETQSNHGSARGERGGLKCDTCGNEWPCRDALLRENGTLRSASAVEYNRHRAAEEEADALRLRLFARYDRIVVIPLIVVAVLELGILLGLWVAP